MLGNLENLGGGCIAAKGSDIDLAAGDVDDLDLGVERLGWILLQASAPAGF